MIQEEAGNQILQWLLKKIGVLTLLVLQALGVFLLALVEDRVPKQALLYIVALQGAVLVAIVWLFRRHARRLKAHNDAFAVVQSRHDLPLEPNDVALLELFANQKRAGSKTYYAQKAAMHTEVFLFHWHRLLDEFQLIEQHGAVHRIATFRLTQKGRAFVVRKNLVGEERA